jgi:hypothetical protein
MIYMKKSCPKCNSDMKTRKKHKRYFKCLNKNCGHKEKE